MKEKYLGFLDGYNNRIHWGGQIIGTIVPQNSRFGFTNGYKIVEDAKDNLQGKRDKTIREFLPRR